MIHTTAASTHVHAEIRDRVNELRLRRLEIEWERWRLSPLRHEYTGPYGCCTERMINSVLTFGADLTLRRV